MNSFRKKLSTILDDNFNKVEHKKDYGLSDLNWKDDGDVLHDPSANDYNKGYQFDPYEMRYYAKNKLYKVKSGDSLASISTYTGVDTKQLYKLNGFNPEKVPVSKHLKPSSYIIISKEDNKVEAAKEVRDMTYTPENLAKEILTLWSQVDGPLQNFYDGFTMNKMNNKMKQEIADILNEWGYDVTPTYTQDTPIYAKAYKNFKKVAKSKDAIAVIDFFEKAFPHSKAVKMLSEEIQALNKEANLKVSIAEAAGLADYYKMIFPDDYTISLVTDVIDKPDITFEEFRDIQISDESLTQMEKMDSGTQDPFGSPNNGGMGGYDFTTHMRSDNGFPAGNYEIRASRLKKKY